MGLLTGVGGEAVALVDLIATGQPCILVNAFDLLSHVDIQMFRILGEIVSVLLLPKLPAQLAQMLAWLDSQPPVDFLKEQASISLEIGLFRHIDPLPFPFFHI